MHNRGESYSKSFTVTSGDVENLQYNNSATVVCFQKWIIDALLKTPNINSVNNVHYQVDLFLQKLLTLFKNIFRFWFTSHNAALDSVESLSLKSSLHCG